MKYQDCMRSKVRASFPICEAGIMRASVPLILIALNYLHYQISFEVYIVDFSLSIPILFFTDCKYFLIAVGVFLFPLLIVFVLLACSDGQAGAPIGAFFRKSINI